MHEVWIGWVCEFLLVGMVDTYTSGACEAFTGTVLDARFDVYDDISWEFSAGSMREVMLSVTTGSASGFAIAVNLNDPVGGAREIIIGRMLNASTSCFWKTCGESPLTSFGSAGEITIEYLVDISRIGCIGSACD